MHLRKVYTFALFRFQCSEPHELLAGLVAVAAVALHFILPTRVKSRYGRGPGPGVQVKAVGWQAGSFRTSASARGGCRLRGKNPAASVSEHAECCECSSLLRRPAQQASFAPLPLPLRVTLSLLGLGPCRVRPAAPQPCRPAALPSAFVCSHGRL